MPRRARTPVEITHVPRRTAERQFETHRENEAREEAARVQAARQVAAQKEAEREEALRVRENEARAAAEKETERKKALGAATGQFLAETGLWDSGRSK